MGPPTAQKLFAFCVLVGGPEDQGPPTAQKHFVFCVLVGGPEDLGPSMAQKHFVFCVLVGGPEDLGPLMAQNVFVLSADRRTWVRRRHKTFCAIGRHEDLFVSVTLV